MDKESYNVEPMEAYPTTDSPPYHDLAALVEEKGIQMGEAAALYGDIQTVEEYGYVHRG